MTGLEPVLKAATKLVIPSADEEKRITGLAEFLLARTREAAGKHPEVRGVVMGGSFAKGTWLPTNVDIDVFVLIDPATPEKDFERIGLAVGTEAAKGFPRGKKYAQHPYVEATVRGVKVNVVPCYNVEPPNWKSAADRSPFHVKLVEGLSHERKTEVRLLKRFMRGVGVYGAEIEVQGFSGYAAEVLVIRHGNFEGVLSYFAELKRTSEDMLFVLPDPVDEDRDLGKAISDESVGRLVLASRAFLRKPSLDFFGEVLGRSRPKMRKEVIGLVFAHSRLSEDTLWGELRRTLKHITRAVEERDFKIIRAMAASDNSSHSAFLFLPEFSMLPPLAQHLGPTVEREKEAASFLAKNRRKAELVWVDDTARLRVLQSRSHTDLVKLLEEISKGRLGKFGASREVGLGMARSARVLRGGALARQASSKAWLERVVLEIASDSFGTSES
ncbi:MAG TPA: CCA tRNA nucleotidyltransferase [Nitrososphaerales archaeon]|nr:CCA tRNA nucleotidyltransferase [Nitrososphaerales archaeon]